MLETGQQVLKEEKETAFSADKAAEELCPFSASPVTVYEDCPELTGDQVDRILRKS